MQVGFCVFAASMSLALPLAAALRITEICPRPGEPDPNGRESGWIEIYNDGEESVDLGDYELQRFNLGKKASVGKFSNLPSAALGPGEYFTVYTSEEYDNAEDMGGDGATAAVYGGLAVVPFKVNPKKIVGLKGYGLTIHENINIKSEINKYNEKYINTKKEKMHHLM